MDFYDFIFSKYRKLLFLKIWSYGSFEKRTEIVIPWHVLAEIVLQLDDLCYCAIVYAVGIIMP